MENLIPKLRFPEFKGEWEKKKLGEVIIDLQSGVSVNSIDEPIEHNNEFGILKTSCISSGKFIPEQNKKIVIEEISRAKLNPIKNSILISRMNTPQLVGESGYVENDYPNLFIPDRLWMTTVDENSNSKFLSILLSSQDTMSKISNIATGTSGSMKNISKPNFLNLSFNFPTLTEQQKIATFLTSVDEKLQALKKKKSLLEQYKKGVMQKIFSQELRFKDENGNDFPEWEDKKLVDVCETAKSGGTPTSTNKDYYNGEIPFLSISDMTSQGKYLRQTSNHISKNGLDNSSSWIVPENSLIYSMYASVGYVSINKIPLATSQAVLNLILKNEVDLEFMYYTLVDFQKNIAQFITTGTQGNLNAQSVKNFELQIPSLKEQVIIANFLTAIDDKINHCGEQIAKMEVWKKGLLQGMFC